MKAIKATFLHALELVICLAAAYFVLRWIDVGSESTYIIVGIVVNALAKFARSSESIPLSDYVNKVS